MAIKNLFGRGIGFGEPHWIVTHGYDSSTSVAVAGVPSPTRLVVLEQINTTLELLDDVGTRLEFDAVTTSLTWLDADGAPMAQPLIITAGETGALGFALVGADGSRQDLTGATCTLRVVNKDSTVVVNAVSLTITNDTEGEVSWNRLLAQVQTPGDYLYQVKAVLAGGDTKFFPDAIANPGNPLTILPTV